MASLLYAVFIFVVIQLSMEVVNSYGHNNCMSLTSNSRLPEPSAVHHALQGHAFQRLEMAGPFWCARRCLQQLKCKSFNYHLNDDVCQLNDCLADDFPNDLSPLEHAIYFDVKDIPQFYIGACEGHSCHPEAVCKPIDSSNYTCECTSSRYGGNNCTTIVNEDPCEQSPCGPQGLCEALDDGGFTCGCPPGFTGDYCQQVVCETIESNIEVTGEDWSELEIIWINQSGSPVDIIWLPSILDEQDSESLEFSIPAAASRAWPVRVNRTWIARTPDTHAVLPMNNQCSLYLASGDDGATNIITAK